MSKKKNHLLWYAKNNKVSFHTSPFAINMLNSYDLITNVQIVNRFFYDTCILIQALFCVILFCMKIFVFDWVDDAGYKARLT